MDSQQPISAVLQRVQHGDRSAVAELLPMVYDELRALAAGILAQQSARHTLQPTAIVNEAYLKLFGSPAANWQSKAHFFAVAAKAMRHILLDYARAKKTEKRGGNLQRITLSGLPVATHEYQVDLFTLNDALQRLAHLDPRQAEIVELRFLGGMSVAEAAHVLGLSTRTVEREWFAARAWLRRELDQES